MKVRYEGSGDTGVFALLPTVIYCGKTFEGDYRTLSLMWLGMAITIKLGA